MLENKNWSIRMQRRLKTVSESCTIQGLSWKLNRFKKQTLISVLEVRKDIYRKKKSAAISLLQRMNKKRPYLSVKFSEKMTKWKAIRSMMIQ